MPITSTKPWPSAKYGMYDAMYTIPPTTTIAAATTSTGVPNGLPNSAARRSQRCAQTAAAIAHTAAMANSPFHFESASSAALNASATHHTRASRARTGVSPTAPVPSARYVAVATGVAYVSVPSAPIVRASSPSRLFSGFARGFSASSSSCSVTASGGSASTRVPSGYDVSGSRTTRGTTSTRPASQNSTSTHTASTARAAGMMSGPFLIGPNSGATYHAAAAATTPTAIVTANAIAPARERSGTRRAICAPTQRR